MHRSRTGLVVSLLLLSTAPGLAAQTSAEYASPFRPLDLPAANSYRAGSGRPGPDYWQQRVDYRIEATLDVERQQLRGRETIRYTNHSPDTLDYLWIFIDQNICAPESITNTLNQPPLRFGESVFDFSCRGFVGGIELGSVTSAGMSLRYQLYGTTMRVELPTPLPTDGVVELDLAWSMPIPEYGAARMGRDGELYEIAFWYPRVAVFDDVKGWNHEPFIGGGEFYLEYGSFDVRLTVPARYVIVATGQLQNPEEVLTAAQRDRLTRAIVSAEPVPIIAAAEVGRPETRPRTDGTLTWHFRAENVRDFAFAGAPNLRWDASGWDGILINTLYRTSATNWPEANRMANQAIRHFSEQWFRYPYPHATTIEGLIEGMEYPMLTFVPNGVSREDLQWVLSHEFGHEWFPMVVGSNERLYPWMDEGFNTFIDIAGAEEYFRGTPHADTVARIALNMVAEHTVPGVEQPMITKPTEVHDLFWAAYRKPALMLHLLQNEVMGKERFDYAFREYIRAWAFKHPTPADFFRVMSDAGGMDLDWFWRGWIYTTARLDHAVDSVAAPAAGGAAAADVAVGALIHLSSKGGMLMPLEMRIGYQGGQSEVVRLPVEMWNLGTRFVYRVRGDRQVVSVELDPRKVMPDVQRGNDVWRR